MATTNRARSIRPISALSDAARAAGDSAAPVGVSIGDTVAELPAAVVAQLADLLDDLSAGRDVTVAPYDLPIGTEWAAELLGVSRPWLTEMLDRGDIPMQRNGTKRRVRLGDLIAYRRADDRRRSADLTWDFLDEE